jgi:hypothetical protein
MAIMSNEVATGRRMKGREGFMRIIRYGTLAGGAAVRR